MKYWMNKETGELLTPSEMLDQFQEEYDGGDDTNACSVHEYFEEVDLDCG